MAPDLINNSVQSNHQCAYQGGTLLQLSENPTVFSAAPTEGGCRSGTATCRFETGRCRTDAIFQIGYNCAASDAEATCIEQRAADVSVGDDSPERIMAPNKAYPHGQVPLRSFRERPEIQEHAEIILKRRGSRRRN